MRSPSTLLALCLIAACGVEEADFEPSAVAPQPGVLTVEWRSEPAPIGCSAITCEAASS